MKTKYTTYIVVSALIFASHLNAFAKNKKPAFGKNAMVSSANPQATQAGLEILKAGGNAFEAAIAVSYALSVAEPYSSGIGGGGFAMVYIASEDKIHALDFREMAPLRASRDMYLDEKGEIRKGSSLHGPLAAAVPGQVAGLSYLEENYGAKFKGKREILLSRAHKLASEGIEVTPLLQKYIAMVREQFGPEMKRIFLPDGRVPEIGAKITQKDLAKTLKRIMKSGRAGFYSGETSKFLSEGTQKAGGIIQQKDFDAYKVIRREPVTGDFKGYEISSFPPPSSGGIHLIQILNILDKYPLNKWGHHSEKMLHHFTEAMRLAYADRAVYLGDPDFVCVPKDGLLSKKYANHLRNKIGKSATKSDELWADDPWKFSTIECPSEKVRPSQQKALLKKNETSLKTSNFKPKGEHTSHFSIVDSEGNAIAVTQTINTLFGSKFIPPGSGVILNNEMDDFSAKPGVPNFFGLIGGEANSITPKKRPLSSMTPTLVFRRNKEGKRILNMVTGTPGGSKIITNTLQTFLNAAIFGKNIQDAVSTPRVHHQWKPDLLYFEKSAITAEVAEALKKKGHELKLREPMCNAQAIWVDADGNRWGGSDSRGEGLAKGI